MTSPNEPLKAGALSAAISKAVVGLLGEYVGRGLTRARTIHSGNLVLCVVEDTMTEVQPSLASPGHAEVVLGLRHARQHTMRARSTAPVEALTHRTAAPFLGASLIDPDLAAEVLVLDEPLPETAHVRGSQ
jgi:uncharacterized protein YbcI